MLLSCTSKSASPSVGQQGVVLVVDDYEDARFLVMCALHRSKIKCIEAATGEEALARARRKTVTWCAA